MDPDSPVDLYARLALEIVQYIRRIYSDGFALQYAEDILSNEHVDSQKVKEILYCVFSLYLIDEIATQPTTRRDFIDMSSYYYRSESFSMDWPRRYMEKYAIDSDHIARRHSLFFSNENFLRNFLKISPSERLGSICGVETDSYDMKCPVSRQEFYINYFFAFPGEFRQLFFERFRPNAFSLPAVRRRITNRLDNYFSEILKSARKSNLQEQIKAILGPSDGYVLTNSGTTANELAIKLVENVQGKSFYHTYWYYENVNNHPCSYFHEIAGHEIEFDTFFVNLNATNFIDMEEPTVFEGVGDELSKLMRILGGSDKRFVLVIDVTINPFFHLDDVPPNVRVIRTGSLSKFMGGMNNGFAGVLLLDKAHAQEAQMAAEFYGVSLQGLDEKYAFIDDLALYPPRITKVSSYFTDRFAYHGWHLVNVGVSYVLVPSKNTVKGHIERIIGQSALTDRQFMWRTRDRINELLSSMTLHVEFGDSFLFPFTRINLQGPEIATQLDTGSGMKYKYRLPRISIGFEEDPGNEKLYYVLFRGIIDALEEEYHKL